MKYMVVYRKTRKIIEWVYSSTKHSGKTVPEKIERGEFKELEDSVRWFVKQVNSMYFLYSSCEVSLMSDNQEIAYSFLTDSDDCYDRWRIRWVAPKVEMDQVYTFIKKHNLKVNEH